MDRIDILPDKASFYPSLMFALKVRVMDAEETYASQDLGAANYEVRHFIDKTYLSSINGGQQCLENMVDPTPPCIGLWGTKGETNETIVGMLKHRLNVTVYMGPENGWQLTKLQNVLVVDKLPVPLHVSLKALKLYPDGEVQSAMNFKKDTFPVEFHLHSYWNSNQICFGSIGNATASIKHLSTGRPNKVKIGGACSQCGKKAHLKCARCKSVSYCSKECQRSDWKRHKVQECFVHQG